MGDGNHRYGKNEKIIHYPESKNAEKLSYTRSYAHYPHNLG